jgi:formate hydrogenlyase subunit 6/NADH:ubiquinone oxidoreductase subunit I
MANPGRMIPEVLKGLTSKPATITYPAVKTVMPADFRGKIKFTPQKCKGCMLCTKDCPAKAIRIIKLADKRFQAEFDLDRCIYCAQCVDSCMAKALEITPEYELAQLDRTKLHIIFKDNRPPVAPEEKTDAKTEVKPEEKA